MADTKWVYTFEEGNADMRNLLGGKGAGLAEMTNIGLPVPPGFTITTQACNAYYDAGEKFPPKMWDQAVEAMKALSKKMGRVLAITAIRSWFRCALGLNSQCLA